MHQNSFYLIYAKRVREAAPLLTGDQLRVNELQLDQLAMRMQHNLEQQIQARNQSGVSEEALREFRYSHIHLFIH